MNREPNTSPENRADVQAPPPADQPRDLARQIDDLPAADAVGLFQRTIEQLVALAVYMPIVAGMGGNASTQAMAVTVRGLALGLVVGFSLIINHTLACTSGALIPFAMKGMGFDPAQSATIFATTVTDVAGFFSLLGLARILLT